MKGNDKCKTGEIVGVSFHFYSIDCKIRFFFLSLIFAFAGTCFACVFVGLRFEITGNRFSCVYDRIKFIDTNTTLAERVNHTGVSFLALCPWEQTFECNALSKRNSQ